MQRTRRTRSWLDTGFVTVRASEEPHAPAPLQRRLHEVVRAADRRRQHQQQDFSQWIQHLGMLSRIGQRGGVIQQRDADLADYGEAFIDEASCESNFRPRRKLSPSSDGPDWVTHG